MNKPNNGGRIPEINPSENRPGDASRTHPESPTVPPRSALASRSDASGHVGHIPERTAPPDAVVLRITPTKTTRIVTVRCPYCARTHEHGWPYESGPIGHRLAHCDHDTRGRGYTIPTPTEAAE